MAKNIAELKLPPFPWTGAMVFEAVRKVLVDQLGVDEADVTPEAHLIDDLNADSLDLVELVMTLEEVLSSAGEKVEISDDDAGRLGRVRQVVWYAWQALPADKKTGEPPEEWPLSTDEMIEERKKQKAKA